MYQFESLNVLTFSFSGKVFCWLDLWAHSILVPFCSAFIVSLQNSKGSDILVDSQRSIHSKTPVTSTSFSYRLSILFLKFIHSTSECFSLFSPTSENRPGSFNTVDLRDRSVREFPQVHETPVCFFPWSLGFIHREESRIPSLCRETRMSFSQNRHRLHERSRFIICYRFSSRLRSTMNFPVCSLFWVLFSISLLFHRIFYNQRASLPLRLNRTVLKI